MIYRNQYVQMLKNAFYRYIELLDTMSTIIG